MIHNTNIHRIIIVWEREVRCLPAVRYFEDKFVYSYRLQPFIGKRFIDDIFFVWTYGQQELDNFVHHLNNCHDTIKFTLETSLSRINFLDITITHESDLSVSTNLYCKPTDSLLFSSEHPRHLLNGIPYSQFVRIKRLCSKDSDFRLNALMLTKHFIRRGYPKHLVLKALERTELLKRETLLNKETLNENTGDPENKKFYCVTTHNPLTLLSRKLSLTTGKFWVRLKPPATY